MRKTKVLNTQLDKIQKFRSSDKNYRTSKEGRNDNPSEGAHKSELTPKRNGWQTLQRGHWNSYYVVLYVQGHSIRDTEDGLKKKIHITFERGQLHCLRWNTCWVGTHHILQKSDSNVQQQKLPKMHCREKQRWKRQYHWDLEVKDSLIQRDLASIHKRLLYSKSETWKSEKVPGVLMLNNDRIPACSRWTQIQDLPKRTSCITYIGSWRTFFLICHRVLFLK